MTPTIFHVKKGDLVQVIGGKEKGKTGKVLRVIHKTNRVVVEKLHMVKEHKKATPQEPGGIVEREGSIHASKVLLYSKQAERGVRTRRTRKDDGTVVRVCAKTGAEIG